MGIFTAVPHPTDTSLIYMGSFISGIVEFNTTTGTYRFFSDNTTNGKIKSSLQAMVGAPTQVRVSHLQFDEQGNLWVANFGAPRPISVFTKDQKWFQFCQPGPTFLTRINIDQRGYKWFATTGSAPGVVVFDDNQTPDDATDDQIRSINSTNSLISAQVNSIETDLNGDVWVGTSQGPIIFDCDPLIPIAKAASEKYWKIALLPSCYSPKKYSVLKPMVPTANGLVHAMASLCNHLMGDPTIPLHRRKLTPSPQPGK